MEFTISKSKVGPLTARYLNGSYQDVDEKNSDGVKRMAVLGLDNSHSKDYKVAYASDPVITVTAGRDATHDDLQEALEELGVWETANFSPIEVPHGDEWRCAFRSLPEDVRMIDLMHKKATNRLDDEQVLGDEESFSVWL